MMRSLVYSALASSAILLFATVGNDADVESERLESNIELTGSAADQIYNEGDGATHVRNSLVESGLSVGSVDAGGNRSGDPAFSNAAGIDNIIGSLDDDYQLTGQSPAVDAGRNESIYKDRFDVDGDGDVLESMPVDHSGAVRLPVGSVVDLGAYEFGAEVAVATDPSLRHELRQASFDVYPVPARGRLRIRANAGQTSRATVVIHDMLGRRVRTIFRGSLSSGMNEITADTDGLASGVYLMVFQTERQRIVRELVVIGE